MGEHDLRAPQHGSMLRMNDLIPTPAQVTAPSGDRSQRRTKVVVVGVGALAFLAAAGAGWGIGSLSASGSAPEPSAAEVVEAASAAPPADGTWSDMPLAHPVLRAIEDRIVIEPAMVDPTSTVAADTLTELLPGEADQPPTTRVVPAGEVEESPVGTVPARPLDDEPVPSATVRMPVPEPVDPEDPDDPERTRSTPDPETSSDASGSTTPAADREDDGAPGSSTGGSSGSAIDPSSDPASPAGDPEEPILGEPPRRPPFVDICFADDAVEEGEEGEEGDDGDELCGLGAGAIVAFGMGGGDDTIPIDGATPISTPAAPRPGRPAVDLREVTERSYSMLVPRRPREGTEAYLVPREVGEETSACGRLTALIDSGHPGIQSLTGRDETRVIAGAGEDEFSVWDGYRFELHASGIYDVCITWYEDLAPARNVVERESWVLVPQGRKRVKIHYGRVDLSPPRDRVLLQPQALSDIVLTFTDSTGRELCYSGTVGLGPESTVVCEFDANDARQLVSASVSPRFHESGGLRQYDPTIQALPIGTGGTSCWDGVPIECRQFAIPLAGPLDGDGPWTIGTAHFLVTYDVPAAGADPSVLQWARTGSFDDGSTEPDVDPDAPRLDLTATRIHYYPQADPFRAWVHWKADRPVSGVFVDSQVRGVSCNRGEPVGALGSSRFDGDGGVVIVPVCPGSSHALTITFTTEDGEQISFGPEGPTSGEPTTHHFWAGGAFRTEAFELPLRVSMRIRNASGSGAWAHVTWHASLQDQLVFSENRHTDFFGSRPSCGRVEEFDISADRATPTPVNRSVGATLQIRLDVLLDLGQSRNLIGQCMSAATHRGGEVVMASLPVESLVRRGNLVTSERIQVRTPSGEVVAYEVSYTVSTPYTYSPPASEPVR